MFIDLPLLCGTSLYDTHWLACSLDKTQLSCGLLLLLKICSDRWRNYNFLSLAKKYSMGLTCPIKGQRMLEISDKLLEPLTEKKSLVLWAVSLSQN